MFAAFRQPADSRQSVAPDRPAHRWKSIVPVVVVVTILLVTFYRGSPNFFRPAGAQHPVAGDFLQEWVGAWMILHGEADRLYDGQRFTQLQHDPELIGFQWDPRAYLPAVYPPCYYGLWTPLAIASFGTAKWIWAALLVASLILSWCLLQRSAVSHQQDSEYQVGLPRTSSHNLSSFGSRNLLPLWSTWGLVAWLLFHPVIESLTSSQKGPLLLLVFTATYLLLKAGRPATAGLICGLLICKPQWLCLIVLWMAMKRQGRFLLGFCGTAVLLLTCGWVLSPSATSDYVAFLLRAGNYIETAGYENHLHRATCLHGAWSLLLGSGTLAARTATLLSSAVVIALLIRFFRGPLRLTDSRFSIQFAAMLLGSCLINPHLFAYDLCVLLLVMHLAATPGSGLFFSLAVYLIAGIAPSVAQATRLELTTPLLCLWLGTLTLDHSPLPQSLRRWIGSQASRYPTASTSESTS